jgi:hypothetical protein
MILVGSVFFFFFCRLQKELMSLMVCKYPFFSVSLL